MKTEAFPNLETKRLYLKQVTKENVADLYETLSKDEVVRYMGIPKVEKITDALNELSWYQRIYQNGTGIRFGLFLKENNKLIGSYGYKDCNNEDKKSEIDYELNSSFWNQGIMTEAIKQLLIMDSRNSS